MSYQTPKADDLNERLARFTGRKMDADTYDKEYGTVFELSESDMEGIVQLLEVLHSSALRLGRIAAKVGTFGENVSTTMFAYGYPEHLLPG
jgi:hypothetical protein